MCKAAKASQLMITKRQNSTSRYWFLVTGYLLFSLVGCSGASSSPETVDEPSQPYSYRRAETITFNKDIAPIVFDHCVICHRPGEAAPFSLLTFQDIAKRAEQIVDVTESRFMPPWKPEPGYGTFVSERHLTEDQIELFGRWVAQGAIQGDPADLPSPPKFSTGWQLGEPDLIVTMTEPYTLPVEGTDVFRNFVIPTSEPALRYVRAVEFRPSNPAVVHHANLRVDPTQMSRRLDEQEPGPGFSGMWGEEATTTGQLVGWHPGRVPILSPTDVAWPLEPGADLLLLLHLLPSGKPETIQFTLGFHFSEQPPTKHSLVLRLFSNSIDIPAGERNYVIEDSLQLPVDAHVFAVRPHAHYLGKDLKGFAKLPDGTMKWLVWIPDWDFNWQEEYRPSPPVFLPSGSTITMQFSYDNSSDNPNNPHPTPHRVRWGPKTEDEMGVLFTQVLVDNKDQLATLEQQSRRHQQLLQLASIQRQLENDPDNATHHVNLGALMQAQGKLNEAIQYFRRAVQIQPDLAAAHSNLGVMLQMQDQLDDAIGHFNEAVQLDPGNAKAQANLASALRRSGDIDKAIHHYRLAIGANPNLTEVHNNLADLLRSRGEFAQASGHYREVLKLKPDQAEVHYHLGISLMSLRQFKEAVEHFQHVVRIRPDTAHVYYQLANAFRSLGDIENSIKHSRQALKLQDNNSRFHYGLAAALTIKGDVTTGLKHLRRAVKLDPNWIPPLNDMSFILAAHPDDTIRDPALAVKLARRAAELSGRQNFSILDTLAVAYAAAGNYEKAVSTSESAINLAIQSDANKMVEQLRLRLELYKTGQPYREAFPTP